MSETPHCSIAEGCARCCNQVKFCYQKSGDSHQFLSVLALHVMESKPSGPGSNEIAGSLARTAMKMQGKWVNLHPRVSPCI